MTQALQCDGGSLLRVRGSTVEVTQTADHGAVGMGRFTINDPTGTIEIVGTKDFSITQDDCTLDVIHRGYIEDRDWRRGTEWAGPAREIDVTVQDLNPILTFLKIGTDGDRTDTETVAERLTWLLDTYLPGLGTDRVTFDTDHTVEPANYSGQDCNEVLAALALAAGGFNHHVQDYGDGPELIFRNDNISTDDTATIFISNRYSDVDWETVFPPLRDFKLTSRPGNVGSKVRFEWVEDAVIEERPQTALDFNGERDITATDSNIKTEAKARDAAQRELWTHHTEEHILEGTILVPPEAVNLAPAGFRIGIRLEHLQNLGGPGITTYFDADEWIYCRILERTVRPKLKPTRLYEIQLKLSPQEPAPPSVLLVQKAFGRGTEAGLVLPFANPVTIGSKLVAVISCRNDADPEPPNITGTYKLGGTGAWTRMNGSTITKAIAAGDGVSAYYKTATATDRTAYFPDQNAIGAIFEFDGADPASAVILDESLASGGPNYDLGTQTPAVGEFAIAVWAFGTLATGPDWSWTYANPSPYPWQTPNPPPNLSAGWTQGISKWSFDHWSTTAFLPAHPWVTIAYAAGTGAALLARAVPGESHPFGGLYIVIPPV